MQRREPVRRAGRLRAGDLGTVAELEAAASGCRLCRLCHDRTVVVTGAGPHDAEVLVVSEAPGYHEDRTGQLLVGRAGELYDDVLQAAGLGRTDVFLTSVVKCRPPTGRTPFPDEVEACEGWLFREIALVRPRVVVTLGQLALRLVTGRQERLGDVHGQLLHAQVQGRDLAVWPLYHPAAASQVATLAEQLRFDARSLGGLLRGARADARPAAQAPAPATGAPSPSPVHDDADDAATGVPQLSMEF